MTAAPGAVVIAWHGYGEADGVTSVPKHLEQHGERLRARYLAFIHDLGESIVAGRPLREHFATGDGYSFWWPNRIAEKSPFKSPRIFDCLRLLALEEILVGLSVRTVSVSTADAVTATAISALCEGLQIPCTVGRPAEAPEPSRARRLYDALPWMVQGLLSLRHLARRWSFRRLRRSPWFSGPQTVFVCSYLYHLDRHATARGQFHSHQWESLPQQLHQHGWRTNWLQHYQPDGPLGESATTALLESFNADADRQGHHALIETYVTVGALLKIVGWWLWLSAQRWRTRGAAAQFRPAGSAAWMWPLLKADWDNSLSGTAAVSHCAWYVLFDAALKDLPRHRRAVFLYEGQGWETALVHAWRKHGHGEIIGVPHSSMPFWYLNIYDDPRCLAADGECRKPLPDRWAINGPMAWHALTEAGYPATRLAPVEALRYTYLTAFATQRPDATGRNGDGPIRLLVLGDYTAEQTRAMLARVAEAASSFAGQLTVTLKLHPACRLDPADGGRWTLAEGALGDLLGDADVVFASNTTSAGLDALIAGVPVLAFLDDRTFNQSPLRGSHRVSFVSTAAELVSGIRRVAGRRHASSASEFFWLDAELPRWRQLLEVTQESHV